MVYLESFIKKHPELGSKRVLAAYELAQEAHKNQSRKSGEPYITHPVEVACIIAKFGGDEDMVCAALLHDILEDGGDRERFAEKIEEGFGPHVYFLVEALSKNSDLECSDTKQKKFIEQLGEALSVDIGVFFIKLADLLHNLESIDSLKPQKRDKWIEELQEQYWPVLSGYYHQISFRHHPMYFLFMDELEALMTRKISKK